MSTFSTVQVLFFLLSIWYSLKGSHTFTIYWPNLMSRELHSTFLREVYLHKLLRIPLHRKFVSSSPFITYSIIYLCHYGLMDTYNLAYDTIVLYSFCSSNSSIFGLWEQLSFASYAPGISPTLRVYVGWLVSFFNSFLLSGAARCSRLILCISYPSSRISQFSKKPSSFDWRMVSKTKIWALGVLTSTGVLLLLACSAARARKYMCIH